MRFCLLICGFAASLFAQEPSQSPEKEWIVTLRPGQQWNTLPFKISARRVRSFGPDNRYVLVKSSKNLVSFDTPKGTPKYRVQPNYIYSVQDALDPDFEKSWGLKNTGQSDQNGNMGKAGVDIGAEPAWEMSTGSSDVIVAVIDTGIDRNHEDLKANLWVNQKETPNNQIDDDNNGYIDDINGWNFTDGNADIQDKNGHGTFCAGIIGAQAGNGKGTRGVNWHLSLMTVKAHDEYGLGTTENNISAIHYAVKNGATIINASWGQTDYDPALYETVQWANSQGVLFVTAAGNTAQNNDTASQPFYPAAFRLPNLITVTSYDARDKLSDFSNFGKETTHIGAPGQAIYSTVPGGYQYGEGTSYAAPFVTGVAALLKAYVPSLTLAELRQRILDSSRVIDYYQKEKTATAGFVSAYNALKDIRPARPTTPSQWSKVSRTEETAHPYSNNLDLSYTFFSAGATHVRVHFASFDTEPDADWVKLTDGKGRQVEIYSGKRGEFTSADALGDTLVVNFHSDSVITAQGFEIDYYEVNSNPLPQNFLQ